MTNMTAHSSEEYYKKINNIILQKKIIYMPITRKIIFITLINTLQLYFHPRQAQGTAYFKFVQSFTNAHR